ETDTHRRAAPDAIRERFDAPAQVAHEGRDHEEPEPGAAPAAHALVLDAIEAMEDSLELLLGDTDPAVLDLEHDPAALGLLRLDGDVQALAVRVLHRVVDEVADHHDHR